MFIKPKSRIKALGEVFTPPELVTKMCKLWRTMQKLIAELKEMHKAE